MIAGKLQIGSDGSHIPNTPIGAGAAILMTEVDQETQYKQDPDVTTRMECHH